MAKANVTRKWVADNYFCCSAGYCNLQNLLRYQSKDYYTCGIYGWNFDVYTFGDYAITTGYRGMIDHVKKDYSGLIREYDKKAGEVLNKYKYDYKNMDKEKEEVNALLKEFLGKVFDRSFEGLVY